MAAMELFSPAQIGAVAGVPVKAIYKTIGQRLPAGFVVRRKGQPLLTRWGAICAVIDHAMPKDVPVAVRKQVYAQIKRSPRSRAIRSQRGILGYVVDVRSAANKIDARLTKYRKAMNLIVEDPDVQAGAATFKGTRILVHQVAAQRDAVGEIAVVTDGEAAAFQFREQRLVVGIAVGNLRMAAGDAHGAQSLLAQFITIQIDLKQAKTDNLRGRLNGS